MNLAKRIAQEFNRVDADISNLDVSPLNKPVITSPLNGAVDYIGNITSTYSTSNSYKGVQDWVRHEASLNVNFTTLIDSYEGSDNLTSWVPNVGLALTTVYVRTRHGSDNHLSAWSDPVSFTTPDTYVVAPSLDVAGAPSSVTLTPMLTGNPFVVMNGTDTHASTDWQVLNASDNSVVWESLNDTQNLLSITTGTLPIGTDLVFRVRYKGAVYGSSAWTKVAAKTLNVYVKNPTITVEGTIEEVPKNPTISGSTFSVVNGTDIHESTDYQVVRVSDGVVVWESLGNTVSKTSIKTGDLVESTAYIFKIRYKGTTYGYSQWVQVTGTTKAVFSVVYGVDWNPTTDTYSRTGLAVGTANSTSYAGAIQTQMKRCVLNANGTVAYYLHPTNSTLKADGTTATIDGSAGNVMVEIPKFYHKYENVGGVHKYSVSPIAEDGYTVHPAFIRGGVEKSFRYYPAYEGNVLSSKLISGSGKVPTVNQTRATFRSYAAANGTGWSLIDWNLLYAVQLLFLTEYATFDTQAMLGNGNDSGSDYTMTTGGSNGIGNGSSSSTNDNTWMSYRGIENWYASMYKFIDGVNVKDMVYFVNNNPATFADNVFTGDYLSTEITSASVNGFISNMSSSNKGFIPSETTGSSSTKVPDYFAQNTGNTTVLFGGIAADGLYAGGFFLSAAAASSAGGNVGSGVSY